VLGLPYSMVKRAIGDWMERKHTEYWRSGKDFKHSKVLMEGSQQGKATKLLNMSRQQLSVVVGLLIGHLCLNGHLYKIGKDINPLCKRCLRGNETVEHLLCECKSLAMSRGLHFWTNFWRASTTLTCPSGPISTVCHSNRTSWELIGGEAQ
jgi:hypothetical protein